MTCKKDKIIQQVLDGFQYNKGKGSFYCYPTSIAPEIVYNVIKQFSNKNKDDEILIVVESYNIRQLILSYLITQYCNNENGYKYRIISQDYIKPKYHYDYKLIITVGINDNITVIKKLYEDTKFMLCILTKNIMKPCFINEVRNILPNIGTVDLIKQVEIANVYTPVEERRIGIKLTDDDLKNYNKATEYINTSLSIFGDLSTIEKCKIGDIKNNISATEFRYNIAINNGWSETLDTSIPIFKQIDDVYNPNVLLNRACDFYNMAYNRRLLVSENTNKLKVILDICNENKDKKILIVSKRGEFAAAITKYINTNSDIKCGDYHDCIDNAIAYDECGNIICVKSGVNKGKPRIVGAQYQSTQNEAKFSLNNSQSINVLSIKNSSNNKLKIACDIVIFTTPLCDDIFDFKIRFNNVKINTIPNIIYKIYSANTIECEKMNKSKRNELIKVIDETENNFINIDENSGEIIL